MMNHLGIDIGTTSICGVVYDSNAQTVHSITRKNTSGITSANPWESLQDAEKIYAILLQLLDDVEKQYDIASISITGQMHGIVYVDGHGKAVSPLFTWQDQRGNLPFKDGQTYASAMTVETGYNVSTGYGLVTHYYNIRKGDVPSGAKRLCTIMDYAAMRLTGMTSPVTDPSNAASLGCFDLEALNFDFAAIKKAGIDPAILPDVVGWDKAVGFYKGKPVFVPIGDNQAGFIGTVKDKEHTVHLSVGTSSQISVFTPAYVSVDGLDTRPFPHGGYIIVGACLCGGSSFAMLHKLYADIIERFGNADVDDDALYALMGSVPYKQQQPDDIVVSTLFEGTRANPSLRGSIGNISANNLTPEALILGFFRGIAQELVDFYHALPLTVRNSMREIAGSGNAISKNSLLRKILEEKFALPLHEVPDIENAALGAGIYGAKCISAQAKELAS